MSPLLITVGGFLGAGKTTLIATAVQRLAGRGLRVAVITNDQAPELVDSALVRLTGVPTAEVAGACFCCAFGDFAARTEELLAAHRPDVVIAEPVGSCVDIAATVLRPLARERGDTLRIAPFSVCVDPAGWRAAEAGRLPAATTYIHRLQAQEADALVLSKCDLETSAELDLLAEHLSARNPAATVHRLSATSGTGVDAWLDGMLDGVQGGQRRIEVDYDIYAAGEACLGWLNAQVILRGTIGWDAVLDSLMWGIRAGCVPDAPAHLKCLLESGSRTLVANCVTGRPDPRLRVLVDGPATSEARLTINARVPMEAVRLREVVSDAIAGLPGISGQVRTMRAFPPGRPVPVHRLA
jgi:Ni2+-binding GTPase involved in maturation of urease and hydrogenase